MGRRNTVIVTDGRGRRLVTSVLALSVLALAGCGQDEGSDAPPATASGSVALSPSHGGLQGGNLVLADTGGGTDGPVTVRFGEAEVESFRALLVDTGALEGVETDIAKGADTARAALAEASGLAPDARELLAELIEVTTARST